MTRLEAGKVPVVALALAVGFVLGMALGRPTGLSAAPQQEDHKDAHAGHGAPAAHSKHWAPVDAMHLYLCAFHVAKQNPKFQIEAHHFCNQHNDVHQCTIYDSNEPNAHLLGVEYIIGNEAYQKLPTEEKKFWHPHAYEIVSGQLIAPDMPKQGDDVFPGLTETWGKTWHTWPDPKTAYPVGEPLLMWSANGDGQIDDKLIAQRDAKFGISTAQIRERRKSFGWEAPQLPSAKSIGDLGRKWTAEGEDKPTPLGGGRGNSSIAP
jgi:hypothetical protein